MNKYHENHPSIYFMPFYFVGLYKYNACCIENKIIEKKTEFNSKCMTN